MLNTIPLFQIEDICLMRLDWLLYTKSIEHKMIYCKDRMCLEQYGSRSSIIVLYGTAEAKRNIVVV